MSENSVSYVTKRDFDLFRKLSWFRVAVGIAGAVLVTLLIIDTTIKEDLVHRCTLTSARADADANNWQTAARIRRQDGDIDVADDYIANVITIRSTIAMPKGWHGDTLMRGSVGDDRSEGCRDAFRPIFPFVR